MKKISECEFDVSKEELKNNFSEADYKIVNELFSVFQSIFPAFRHAWPTEHDFERSKREWIKSFKFANLNDLEVIKKGVDQFRMAETPFVPSPGQFIAMCKPEVSLVPPMYIALPKPEVSIEKQRNEMNKVREKLGLKPK